MYVEVVGVVFPLQSPLPDAFPFQSVSPRLHQLEIFSARGVGRTSGLEWNFFFFFYSKMACIASPRHPLHQPHMPFDFEFHRYLLL
jgi:hypothetical protein